jgi:hypothetical protein
MIKDIIYFVIIGGLFCINVVALCRNRNKDNIVYRIVLLSRAKDWLYAILLIASVITLLIFVEPIVPEFLKFSIFSLLGKSGTNANIALISVTSEIGKHPSNMSDIFALVVMYVVFAILLLLLPKTAYWEEITFRHEITEFKKSITSNIKFGFLHCLVGVPLWIGAVLILVGFVFTMRYIREYKKHNVMADALNASTSLHGKYNVLLILIAMTVLTFDIFVTK